MKRAYGIPKEAAYVRRAGYKVVKSGWDDTWVVIPPNGLYEDKDGWPTRREAILTVYERLVLP
jgi:hypothetical protein